MGTTNTAPAAFNFGPQPVPFAGAFNFGCATSNLEPGNMTKVEAKVWIIIESFEAASKDFDGSFTPF
jgi:hypothetical protein